MLPVTCNPLLMIDGVRSFAERTTPALLALLPLENMLPCPDELHRIDWLSVEEYFVVDMRTVAAAGASDAADLVAIADLLPFLDQNAVQMGIAGAYAETMIDFHHSAVTRFPAAENDLAGSGGKDRRLDAVGKEIGRASCRERVCQYV